MNQIDVVQIMIDEERREGYRRGGLMGCHNRWHRDRAIFQPKCELCWKEIKRSDMSAEQEVEVAS